MMGWGLPFEWADLIMLLIQWICVIAIVVLNVIILIWLERKVSGFIQMRLGPNRVGPFGIFQTFADTFKLMTKEDIIPNRVDKWIFLTAPLFMIFLSVMLYVVIPFGEGMQVMDLDVGLLFFISIGSLTTICLIMAG